MVLAKPWLLEQSENIAACGKGNEAMGKEEGNKATRQQGNEATRQRGNKATRQQGSEENLQLLNL